MSSELLQAVSEVAALMGNAALAHYGRRLAVETKADGSPVTIADKEGEAAARAWIAQRFPNDGILGEELGEQVGGTRRWLLDPIDGTKSFVRRVPLWGSLVAVCEGDTVLAGAAHFPAVGELMAAARGEGCWWNGSRCRVSSIATLSDATVLTTDTRFVDQALRADGWQALNARAFIGRTWGDAYGYLLVASGRAEVMADPRANPWDAAPVMPLVEEAGGVFTDWGGQHTAFGGSAVATNEALALEARALLRHGGTA
jgi:histidinol phosphatase-like enzyme (inositol monophosphatase family)